MNEKLRQAVLDKNAEVIKSILTDLIVMISDDLAIDSAEARSLISQTETFRVLNEETPLDFEYNIISIHQSILSDILKNMGIDTYPF